MRFIFFLIIIVFNSCNLERKPQLIIPNETIDKIFTKVIDNPMAEKYNLTKLRELSLSKGDLEIRIWVSIGSEGIDGLILKRTDNKWSATAIKEIDCNKISYFKKDKIYQTGKVELQSLSSGWGVAWQKLVDAGLLDLPDFEGHALIDGFSYIVELNINNTYRFYRYFSPDYYKNKELDSQKQKNIQQILEIGKIISDEFNLGNFKEGNLCL